jgi:hypothetical protein
MKPAYFPNRSAKKTSMRATLTWISVGIVGFLAYLFFSGQLVVGGVPSSIILTFLQDKPALKAYLRGDSVALHDRLQELNVEARIKDYYRPEIPDEVALDRYIHQIFYDRTGYVGQAYWVNSQGQLMLREGFNPLQIR